MSKEDRVYNNGRTVMLLCMVLVNYAFLLYHCFMQVVKLKKNNKPILLEKCTISPFIGIQVVHVQGSIS
jgi:hypothetical protein